MLKNQFLFIYLQKQCTRMSSNEFFGQRGYKPLLVRELAR